MYTEQQYENEKLMMSKQERLIQLRFEKMIDLLIMYKQSNPTKDVYLSEKCINDAVKWFQKNMSGVFESIKDNI